MGHYRERSCQEPRGFPEFHGTVERSECKHKREIFKLLEKYTKALFLSLKRKQCNMTACSIFSRQIFGGASVNRGIEVGWRVFA